MQFELPVEQRNKIGRNLILAAWGVEIVAASIGILIAALIIWMSQQDIQKTGTEFTAATNLMSAFLGGLPFIVVAMVELTKIPLATAFYLSNRPLWKFLIGLGLLFLLFITFETILNGFERNFTQRTYVVKKYKQDLIKTESELEEINKLISDESAVTSETVRANFDAEIAQINSNRIEELNQIDIQVAEAKKTYSGRNAQILNEQKETLEADIAQLRVDFSEERSRIDTDYTAKTSVTTDTVQQQREQIEAQIEGIQSDIRSAQEQLAIELDGVADSDASDENLVEKRRAITSDFDLRIRNAREEIDQRRSALRDDLSTARSRLESLQQQLRDTREEATIFDRKEDQIDSLVSQISSEESAIGRIDGELRNLSSDATLERLSAQKDEALSEAEASFMQQASAGSREREQVRNRYNRSIRELQGQMTELRSRLAELSPKSVIEAAATERDQAIESLTANYDQRIQSLEVRRQEIIDELNEAYATTEGKLQPELERLNNLRNDTVNKYNSIQAAAQARFNENLEQLKDRKARLDELSSQEEAYAAQRVELRDQIARVAEDSQIYRIAALWYGKDSPADITNEELRLISIVWFGSLAAITAWTGTLLAFAGLVVKYGGQTPPEKETIYSAFVRLLRSMRALIADRRRQVRAPKIVEKVIEKEVPVEVVKEVAVEKIQFFEVPKEVLKRELVYVPVFSDDPELLEKAIHQTGGVPFGEVGDGKSQSNGKSGNADK